MDQEEIDERERKSRGELATDMSSKKKDRLGLQRDPDFDKIDSSSGSTLTGQKTSEINKIIGLKYFTFN